MSATTVKPVDRPEHVNLLLDMCQDKLRDLWDPITSASFIGDAEWAARADLTEQLAQIIRGAVQ